MHSKKDKITITPHHVNINGYTLKINIFELLNTSIKQNLVKSHTKSNTILLYIDSELNTQSKSIISLFKNLDYNILKATLLPNILLYKRPLAVKSIVILSVALLLFILNSTLLVAHLNYSRVESRLNFNLTTLNFISKTYSTSQNLLGSFAQEAVSSLINNHLFIESITLLFPHTLIITCFSYSPLISKKLHPKPYSIVAIKQSKNNHYYQLSYEY